MPVGGRCGRPEVWARYDHVRCEAVRAVMAAQKAKTVTADLPFDELLVLHHAALPARASNIHSKLRRCSSVGFSSLQPRPTLGVGHVTGPHHGPRVWATCVDHLAVTR